MGSKKENQTVVQKLRNRLLQKNNVSQSSTVTKARNAQNRIIEEAFNSKFN